MPKDDDIKNPLTNFASENGSQVPYILYSDPTTTNDPSLVAHADKSLIEKLINKTFNDSKKQGFTFYDGVLNFFSLGVGGVACYIYYQPNIDAGKSLTNTAEKMGLSKDFFSYLLTGSSLPTNYLLNAYFISDEFSGIVDAVQSTSLSKSPVAEINTTGLSVKQKRIKLLKSTSLAALKTIPVAFSTFPYIALSLDKDSEPVWFKPILLPSTGVTFGLMHWKAVGALFDDIGIASFNTFEKARNKCFAKPQALLANANSSNKTTVFSTAIDLKDHKKTIETALHQFRYLVQTNNMTALKSVHELLNNSTSTGIEIIGQLLTVLNNNKNTFLGLNDQKNITIHWLYLAHLINGIGSIICSIGYFMATYRESANICNNIFGEAIEGYLCYENSPWNISSAISGIVLFGYLIAFVGAVANTQMIWDLLLSKHHVNSLAYQQHPWMIKTISALLVLSALFSWGTTIALNNQYIPEEHRLWINIVSTFYNGYFNAFPIPLVVPGMVHKLDLWTNKLLCRPEDQTQKSNFLMEAFLERYLKLLVNIEQKPFEREFLKLSQNQQELLLKKETPSVIKTDTDLENNSSNMDFNTTVTPKSAVKTPWCSWCCPKGQNKKAEEPKQSVFLASVVENNNTSSLLENSRV